MTSENIQTRRDPGDGVGPEVIKECVKILDTAAALDGRFAFTYEEFPWGCEYYLKTGEMMPADGMDILSGFDAILLGAVGFPGVPDHISLRDLRSGSVTILMNTSISVR